MAEGEVTGHGFPTQEGEREGRIRMIVIQVFIEVGQVVIVLAMIVARGNSVQSSAPVTIVV